MAMTREQIRYLAEDIEHEAEKRGYELVPCSILNIMFVIEILMEWGIFDEET